MRPSIDSAMPRRSAGTASRSKPDPGRGRRRRCRRRPSLRVDRDLVGARELRGVRHRLPRREDELLVRGVELGSAGGRELDPDAVELLDLGGCVGERVLEGGGVLDAAAVEPAAKLALLPPRDRRDAMRIVGVPLDERERLEDGVVHTRSDGGALRRGGCVRCVPRPAARATARARASSAPAIAPGATKEPEAPRWPSRITAPAVVSTIAGMAASRPAAASRRAPQRSQRRRGCSAAPISAVPDMPSATQQGEDERRRRDPWRRSGAAPPSEPTGRGREGCRHRPRARAARTRGG